MHECGITHGDIKLQNYVFDKDFLLKVTDFGFSVLSEGPEGDGILREGKGTCIYWAPEIHKRCHRGLDRDVFASVIILFLIYTGYPPFTNTLPQNDKYRLLKEGNPAQIEKFWEKHGKRIQNVPTELKRLFEQCFREDPEERLTLSLLLNHSWVNTDASSEAEVKAEL